MSKTISSLQQVKERKEAVKQLITEKESYYIDLFHSIAKPFKIVASLVNALQCLAESDNKLKNAFSLLPSIIKTVLASIQVYKTFKKDDKST